MARTYWLTPEERLRKKARNKKLLYAAIIFLTVLLSVAVTVIGNQL